MAMEKMLAGLSTRRYPVGLEPVGEQADENGSAISKSAVSRKFVATTETALADTSALPCAESELYFSTGVTAGGFGKFNYNRELACASAKRAHLELC